MSLQQVFNQIDGWCSWKKAKHLRAICEAMNAWTVVEIGVYHGKSAIPMAAKLLEMGTGRRLVAIDPWTASASIQHQDAMDQQFWANQLMHERAYEAFQNWVKVLKLDPFVEIVRQRSDDADVPASICVLHIDGNHSIQAVKDVERYSPKVIPGGFVILDDISWKNGGPSKAAELLSTRNWRCVGVYQFDLEGKQEGMKDDYSVFQRTS